MITLLVVTGLVPRRGDVASGVVSVGEQARRVA